jgi:hypothetical protein
MKHLLSWCLVLILAVMAGGCRTTPPVPEDPKPRKPELDQAERLKSLPASPSSLAKEPWHVEELLSTYQGKSCLYDSVRGMRVSGSNNQSLPPPPSPEMFKQILVHGKSYECDPTRRELVPRDGQPYHPWGSPGDTVKPQLEYMPLAYSAPK